MKVTQEDDRVPGKGILAVLAGVVVLSAIGVLAAYLITEWRSDALAREQEPPVYIEPMQSLTPVPEAENAPAPAPSAARTVAPTAIPGHVSEEVNQIEQVLFAERAPGLEERAREQAVLRSYGWADRNARLVRIPIDRAIELYVQRAGQGYREEQP